MPTLTIKGLSDELYLELKARAEANHRSLNAELIWCVERALRVRRISPEDFLVRARRLRAGASYPPLTDALLDEGKRTGRP